MTVGVISAVLVITAVAPRKERWSVREWSPQIEFDLGKRNYRTICNEHRARWLSHWLGTINQCVRTARLALSHLSLPHTEAH